MRFTELRDGINAELKEQEIEINSLHDYMRKYLMVPIQDKITGLNNQFVEHLYEDIIEKSIDADLKTFLGGSYNTANEFAKTCVHLVFKSKDIYGYKIAGWTDAALKCFDNLLLVFIQEKLKETVKYSGDKGVERQKYQHLIEKGGSLYEIGIGFDIIYSTRNDFMHIEFVDDKSGIRRQKPLNHKTLRNMKSRVLENFKNALLVLEKEIV